MSLTEESDAAFAEFLRNEPSLMSNKEKRERYIEETIEKAMIEGRDDRNKELERLERLTKEDQMAENKEPFKPKRLKKQSPAFYQLNDEFIAFHQGPNGYKGGALAGRELKEDDLLERVLSFLHRKVELSKECDLATGQPVLGEDGKPRYMSYGTLTDLAKLLANVATTPVSVNMTTKDKIYYKRTFKRDLLHRMGTFQMIYNLKREMRISPVYVDVTLEEGLDGVTRVVHTVKPCPIFDEEPVVGESSKGKEKEGSVPV